MLKVGNEKQQIKSVFDHILSIEFPCLPSNFRLSCAACYMPHSRVDSFCLSDWLGRNATSDNAAAREHPGALQGQA